MTHRGIDCRQTDKQTNRGAKIAWLLTGRRGGIGRQAGDRDN